MLVFARRSILPLPWLVRVEPLVIVAAAGALAWNADLPAQLLLIGSLQLLVFFVIAMVCHGQLAADRPARRYLTEFYLWMSLGGVLGGLLNALVAPLVFPGAWEYPLMLVAACLLRPRPAGPRQNILALAPQIVLPAAVLVVCCGVTWMLRSQIKPLEWSYADASGVKVGLVLAGAVAAFFLRRRPMTFALGVAVLLAVCFTYPRRQSAACCTRSGVSSA